MLSPKRTVCKQIICNEDVSSFCLFSSFSSCIKTNWNSTQCRSFKIGFAEGHRFTICKPSLYEKTASISVRIILSDGTSSIAPELHKWRISINDSQKYKLSPFWSKIHGMKTGYFPLHLPNITYWSTSLYVILTGFKRSFLITAEYASTVKKTNSMVHRHEHWSKKLVEGYFDRTSQLKNHSE